ncbi:hypothetical protein DRJ16_02890 [Candidatus Woesearchaeota archaeon]|nr:MAG: hypothetical protein DRJ16_02890 [Candidatus Woesearchaeota archaeon]
MINKGYKMSYEVTPAVVGRKLISSTTPITSRVEYLLSDNSAPSALIIARAPVGTVWFKATPNSGETTFFQKVSDGSVKEGGALS